MADPTFRGVGVALITLFAPDGSVDVPGTAAHARRVVDAGVRAVLVAGTTGEAETLDDAEREDLIAATRDALPDDITVIAGASGSWARDAAARAAAARKAGADTVLVSPARGGVDQVALFTAVAEAVGDSSRVIGYHNPGPLGVPGIEVSALPDLPIGAVKDSSADPARMLHELSTWDGNVYIGSGSLITYAGIVGATGSFGGVRQRRTGDLRRGVRRRREGTAVPVETWSWRSADLDCARSSGPRRRGTACPTSSAWI